MKRRLACGTSWGHAGDTPGFAADVHNSLDGSRQSVALINTNLANLQRPARKAFFRLSASAYCADVGAHTARQPLQRSHESPRTPP